MPRSATPTGRAGVGDGRAEQDRALFARYLDQRDPVDRAMLVERFLPLARQLARRYQRAEEPFDDLFQVACLGLINAIDRFDFDRGVAFSSYAVPTILGEIKRYFRDRTWSVRVARGLQDLALKVDRAVSELDMELHRKPTVAEIGAKVGADEEDVLEALEACDALPGHVAADAMGRRRRQRRHPGRRHRPRGARLRAGRGSRHDRARHAGHHSAPARGPAPAVRRGPHTGRDRRANRHLQMQVSRVIRQALARLRSCATARERAYSGPSGSDGVFSRRASQSAFAH